MKHRYTEAGDTRENSVPCHMCLHETWNVCGLCDDCCDHTGATGRPLLELTPETRFALTQSGRMLLGVKRGSWS